MHYRESADEVRVSRMADEPPYDPRAVANLLLDIAAEHSRLLSNLALQKLVYFAHALFLVEAKRPLVKGYFEAWQYGPVHPTIYQAFKAAREQPIEGRAVRLNPSTGEQSEVEVPRSIYVRELLTRIMVSYGRLTPGRLVDITHAKNARWDYVVNKHKTSPLFGGRIPDNVIAQRFKHHKIAVAVTPAIGEPSEDAPPSGD
jgi:uncharacterized phage-associated protein